MGYKSGFYLFIGRTGELKFFFNELKASYCSDMNVQGFELLGRKEGRANLQGVIMVRPGVEGEGESSC